MQDSPQPGSAVFPDFLLPDVYGTNLKNLRASLGEDSFGREVTPLLPLVVSRRLIENSFIEIMADYQLLDLTSFLALLDAQCADSLTDPAGLPARWALVNAVLALALRAKTAPGSEAELSEIPRAYYRNATTVIPNLILQASTSISIQALLAMAIFARGTSDTQAFITLSTNASRLLELFSLKGLLDGGVVNVEEEDWRKRAVRVALLLEKDAIEKYSAQLMLRSEK
ncbi:hypothetical protein G7046_g148 [Stylonectria norvegica]|nr:hypothetical protein G7046_g148 [Stylonectria norvegica]